MSIASWLGWAPLFKPRVPESSAPKRFRVIVVDRFHKGDEDAVLQSGTYGTRRAAIDAVKRWIDAELTQHWAYIRDKNMAGSRLDELIGQYGCFAEHPVAFDSKHEQIFDGMAYMEARAKELVGETPKRSSIESASRR